MKFRGSPEEKRQRAQLHFEKGEQRRIEAEKSLDDHRAKIQAETDKTARLRALRLAKVASDALAAQTQANEKKVTASPKATRKKAPRETSPKARS